MGGAIASAIAQRAKAEAIPINWSFAQVTGFAKGSTHPWTANFAERKILHALLFPPKQESIYDVLSAT